MAKPSTKTYASRIGASERLIQGGRWLTPGEPVELDDEAQKDPHNARLIESGQLIEVGAQQQDGGEK